jgi:tetratricopeptide (TPR) repeat protein
MKDVHALLRGFSMAERHVLMQLLAVVPQNHQGKDNKLLKLAVFLLSKAQPPGIKECIDGIYGKGNSGKKIFNLINRLRGRVQEMMIIDPLLDQNKWLEELDVMAIRVRKRIAQFQLLYNSGKGKHAMSLLDETIALCRDYEFYASLVECLKFKKWMIGFRQGEKNFDALAEEIAYYDSCNQAVTEAADTYYKVIMRNDFSSVAGGKEKFRVLVRAIARLSKHHAVTRSVNVEYYLKLIEMDYHQERHEYMKARSACLQLITIVRYNKSVFRKARVASAYGNLSRCELYLKRYDASIEYARESQRFMTPGSVNMTVAREQEFYALFFSGRNLKAHRMIQQIMAGTSEQLGDFRHDKYRFFLACTLFKEKKFHQSLKILEAYQEIAKDKAGWEMAIRLLRIMCYVETGNMDGAIRQIEAFRKHISAHSSKTELSSRYQVILRVLQLLEKDGFATRTSCPKMKDYLNLLRSTDTFYSWEMLGPELIPFHEWVDSRITFGKKQPVAVKI